MLYKECAKCGGDLQVEDDQEGCYVRCMQCGWSKDIANGNGLRIPPVSERKKPDYEDFKKISEDELW